MASASWPPQGSSGSGGITSINADTTAAQTLTVGTSGSDFAITDDLAGGHTFNLPTASSTKRGALSSADWTTFNSKQSTVSFGAFGSTPNSSGGGISGGVITLQPADGTNPGGVSTTTQTFGGAKTFAASANSFAPSVTLASASSVISLSSFTFATAALTNSKGIFISGEVTGSNATRTNNAIDARVTGSSTASNRNEAILAYVDTPGAGADLSSNLGNIGVHAEIGSSTSTGYNVSLFAISTSGKRNFGMTGYVSGGSSSTNAGVCMRATKGSGTPFAMGGYFALNTSAGIPTPPSLSAALIADNGDEAEPIFLARDNASTVFTIADGGGVTTTSFVVVGTRIISGVSTLTDGATPALDASLGNTFVLDSTQNPTIAVPSNATNGQRIVILFKATSADRTLSLNTGANGFKFGTDITGLTATTSGTTDAIGCIYTTFASINKWIVVSYVKGFS